MVFDFRRAELDFAEGTTFDGVPLSQSLNSITKTIEGGLELYLTPLTTFSVVASRQTDRFDQSPEKNADTFRILPSIRMEAPAIIRGSLAVGYRRFSAIDPATPDYSGVVAQGSLTHTFAEQTKVDLLVSRDVQYSFEETQPYYLTTGFPGRADSAAWRIAGSQYVEIVVVLFYFYFLTYLVQLVLCCPEPAG